MRAKPCFIRGWKRCPYFLLKMFVSHCNSSNGLEKSWKAIKFINLKFTGEMDLYEGLWKDSCKNISHTIQIHMLIASWGGYSKKKKGFICSTRVINWVKSINCRDFHPFRVFDCMHDLGFLTIWIGLLLNVLAYIISGQLFIAPV